MTTVTINNLAELKRAMQVGTRFKVSAHQKSGYAGQVREISKVQTTKVWNVIAGDPRHEVSTCNGGRGTVTEFSQASHYEFGESIKWYKYPVGTKDNHLIMEFVVLQNKS